jgi:hypothetical protein
MTGPLHPESLTWAALLGRWLDLAAASTVLSDEQQGPQWRRSISSLVTLQAVVFALDEFDALDGDERPVALDRAEVLVSEARIQLEETWPQEIPASLVEALDDAEEAIGMLETRLVWILQYVGTQPLCMPELKNTPCTHFEGGTLALVPPGTIVMPGAPMAWWICRREPELCEAIPEHRVVLRDRPLQVWRMMDESGQFVSDRVTDLECMFDQAVPLLVPWLVDGIPQESFPVGPEEWSRQLEERLPPGLLEVTWDDAE